MPPKNKPGAGGTSQPGRKQKSNSDSSLPLPVIADNIPAELRALPQWVVWRIEMRAGKPTKVPYDARTGQRAKSNDPTTWCDFGAAVEAYRTGRYAGVGFMLGAGDGLAGVDLDHVIDPATGEIEGWAIDVLDRFGGTYIERSPSGTGFRIFCRGEPRRSGKGTAKKRIEVYAHPSHRYLTVTGHRWPDSSATVTHQQAALDWLYDRYFARADKPASPPPAPTGPADLHDDAIVQKIIASKQGSKFLDLWAGNPGSDASAADLSLCSILAFWVDRDPVRIDRLFRRSGLYRNPGRAQKWDKRHFADGRTYGQATVDRAISSTTETYRAPAGRKPAGKQRPRQSTAASAAKLPTSADGRELTLDDFASYLPDKKYIFLPTGDLWPASGVDAVLPKINGIDPSAWLDDHNPVHQMVWVPGEPQFIDGRLLAGGGSWIDKPGSRAYNLYRPPRTRPGDPAGAQPWIDHIRTIYPDEAEHILDWFAHRVQRPGEKINHALVLGGEGGIGKDTIVDPVGYAIGPWNLGDITPVQLLGRFNGWVKSVILRISEARDRGGNMDRYAFYEHSKIYCAAPPDVILVDEKNRREYGVVNVCGVLITTNHREGGLYLPADDRRHYVAWSSAAKDDFGDHYFDDLRGWLDRGGRDHVAAYLAARDISGFRPKAPPKKTDGWWAIANADRSEEDADLDAVIEDLDVLACGQCRAYTMDDIRFKAEAKGLHGLVAFLADRKNFRAANKRLATAGFDAIRNPDADNGLWRVDGKKQVMYARTGYAKRDQLAAAHRRKSGSGGSGGSDPLSPSSGDAPTLISASTDTDISPAPNTGDRKPLPPLPPLPRSRGTDL